MNAARLLLLPLFAAASLLSPSPVGAQTPAPANAPAVQVIHVKQANSSTSGAAPSPRPTPQPAASPIDYTNEPLVIEHSATLFRYNADATGERTLRSAIHLQSDAAVREFGVLNFSYAADNESVEPHYVRVRKPDGTVLATDVAAAQDMPAEVTRQAPLYSDQRQLQIPVRSLAVGDRIEYEIVIHMRKPEAPGEFWNALYFEPKAVTLDESIELRYPASRKVSVLSPAHKAEQQAEAGDTVYRWHSTQLKPTVAPPGGAAPGTDDEEAPRLIPDVAWTSFSDWAAVGAWYRSLAADRAQPNDTLRAKAAALTAGAATDNEKINRLYSFVSMQIRYIGVDFGIGRFQPHTAAEVLANGYGDCKDKHTLLAALLAAAGFHADPVLIGAGIHLDKDLPAPNNFNHVITVVERPGGQRLWLDATAEVAPPGMLIAQLRDVDALLIPPASEAAPSLVKTPATPPFQAYDHYEAHGTLGADGAVKAHFEVTLRGDLELILRAALFGSGRGQWEQIAQGLSGGMGFGGTVTAFNATGVDTPGQALNLTYDYSRDNYGDWPNHRTLALLPGGLFAQMEPTKQPPQPIELGAPRLETARSTLELPPGFSAPTLPPDLHAKSSFATYDLTYALHGSALVTEEKLQILIPTLAADKWQELSTFSRDISNNSGAFITLAESTPSDTPGTASTAAAAPAKPAAAPIVVDARAQQLVEEARTMVRGGQLPQAQAKLDEVRAINPGEPGLWWVTAMLEAKQNHLKEAEADLRKETTEAPEMRFEALSYLLWLQRRQKENAAAIETLDSMRKLHPEQAALVRQEAALLSTEKRPEEAIPLLEGVALRNPSDKLTMLALGNAQFAAGRLKEGQITLEAALEGTDDPEVLNDAAYALADHNLDLPAAAEDAQKALVLLEKQIAPAQLTTLDAKDLSRQQLLGAIWDTVGWIHYLQGDLAAAEDYLRAAWIGTERAEVGYHLGMLYEKQGKPQQALATYTLADGARSATAATSPDLEALRQHREALSAKGLKDTSDRNTSTRLADLRSVELPPLVKTHEEADFLIAATAHGVTGVSFIGGSPLLQRQAESLRKALNTNPSALIFPKDSAAYQFRRGILSCSPLIGKCQFVLFLPQDTQFPKPTASLAQATPAPAPKATEPK